GRLIRLQLEELMGGVEDDRRLAIQDYSHMSETWNLAEAMEALSQLTTEEILDLRAVTSVLHLPSGGAELDYPLQPKGYRLLHRIPRMPEVVIEAIVARFGTLDKILDADVKDLDDVEGVGASRARAIKENLSRIAEGTGFDRF
ncbi:MAG TPA: helix-hairpin-helix domain-containing protein, partial [Acidimicrobiales bacterium]|nr:helix-hairpin-helix domain-containing protein [Acidimicrobiales bacterium]